MEDRIRLIALIFMGILTTVATTISVVLIAIGGSTGTFWTSPPTPLMLGVFSIMIFGFIVLSLSQVEEAAGTSQSAYSTQELAVRRRGPRVVAIGGGTGLPSALRALKSQTNDLAAVVTVADDGGSSGRLRRDMGVIPPGDLRNNIVALADNESTMAKLFQYRFEDGDLKGHSFGNLFISALASVTEGGLESSLAETARVLNIQGRVLPSSLQDVNLRAQVLLPGKTRSVTIFGEAAITDSGGQIEHIELVPPDAKAYPESVQAIQNAELVVIGPGSLYTSILPNLLVPEIANALRASNAYIIYVCNIATQPGETDGYTVAEHAMAVDQLIGRGVFQAILANDTYPAPPEGVITDYVMPAPENHEIFQRYEVFYTDLTEEERPWRHDPVKLSRALMALYESGQTGKPVKLPGS
ncbi:MAG: gluconeogenesis factor YvcK family protein [Chloroflexota bacterium]